MQRLLQWLRKIYNQSIHSIGFYPALIAVFFLAFAVLMLQLDDSASAKALKERWPWFTVEDPDAARNILTTIASGVLAMTVFTFSMVMIVMSQAASQMSNRLLDNLIGNRFQQLTLGFYIGTIINAFFLLSAMQDSTVAAIPSLSVYALVIITIVDIFLFVYFLHYITQSIRYEQLIKRIHKQTSLSLGTDLKRRQRTVASSANQVEGIEILAPRSDYFQGFNQKLLLRFLTKNQLKIEFVIQRCTYVVKGTPVAVLQGNGRNQESVERVLQCIDFYTGQEIDKNPYYGYLHLTEVAMKALSPGINDPGTALLSIHALTDLLTCEIRNPHETAIADEKGDVRIIIPPRDFKHIFSHCVYAIWDYGKKDRFIRTGMKHMVSQLITVDENGKYREILGRFDHLINEEEELNERTGG